MTATFSDATVERLIRISKEKPLLPEIFVPWHEQIREEDRFMPEHLISLQGHPLWDTLSPAQQRELGRHEVVQVMYSYAWSEGLACLFFNRHLLTLSPESVEYRFLLRELIEEFRHQEMFSAVVTKLEGKPVTPDFWHRFWGKWSVKNMPADCIFMSVLSVELMTDVYGKHIRRDERVSIILRKVSELHNIEEGRHIFYTKLWLERFTSKAGFFRRSWYSIIVLLNLYFMCTLYVKAEIFGRIGVQNPERYAQAASQNLKQKLGANCLEDAVEFVQGFQGFNWLTRPLWRWVMKVKVL
ncbi:MAG: diiron oxygenase [Phycisphaerae bacterium]|nr:diiron oxygenase [Saprospiraceae bacterium]